MDGDDATAIEPVIVAGGFLACAQELSAAAPEQSELFCGLNSLDSGTKIELPEDIYAAKAYLVADSVQFEIFPKRIQGGTWHWRTSLGVNLQTYDLLLIRLASKRNLLWTKFFITRVAKIPRINQGSATASAASK